MRVVNVLFKTAVLYHRARRAVTSCACTNDNELITLSLYLVKVDVAVVNGNVDAVKLVKAAELVLMRYQRAEIGHADLLLIFRKLDVRRVVVDVNAL